MQDNRGKQGGYSYSRHDAPMSASERAGQSPERGQGVAGNTQTRRRAGTDQSIPHSGVQNPQDRRQSIPRNFGTAGGGSSMRSGQSVPRNDAAHRRSGQTVGQASERSGQQSGRSEQPSARSGQVPGQTPARSGQTSARASGQTSGYGAADSSMPVGAGERAAVPAKSKKQNSAVAFFKKAFRLDESEIQRERVFEDTGYDYVFLVIVLVLLAFGTVMVYSASYAYSNWKYGDSYYIISRQFIFVFLGLIAMLFTMWFKPEAYRKYAVIVYLACFFLLCIVPIPGIGRVHGGARRWLSLGFTEIQPSEFMKTGLVLMLAWYFDRYHKRVVDHTYRGRASFFGVYVPLGIVGVTCVLMLLEKHLSGTVIMFLIGMVMIFVSGANLRPIYVLGGVGVALLTSAALILPHAKERVQYWLHPELDPQDKGYQTLQGLYAIGSGGFFGVGLGEGRQKHMFVSQPQNDFIFSIVCEELGFIGAVTVILLFLLFLWRGITIAMRAPDVFSSLVVAGIVCKVVLQAVLNIAVVTKSIPNTGISLPFFSYGGSSLCVLIAEMGIVLSISRYTRIKS